MKKILTLSLSLLFCAGCVGSALEGTPLQGLTLKDQKEYDPARDVSPVEIPEKYKPVPLSAKDAPFDSIMAMNAIVQMIRGERPAIDRLVVSPGMDLTEPGIPLEYFSFVDLTILGRMERETVKGRVWETRTMAVLTFIAGPFKALVLAEAFCTVTPGEVQLTRASVYPLSPAQPRVVAWFVPKRRFFAALESEEAVAPWDLMVLANSMAVRVGEGLRESNDDYLAVAIVLDRLEPKDRVQGGVSAGPMPYSRWFKKASVSDGIGFPVLMAELDGPLNVKAKESFLHVVWTPSDKTRTAGERVPIGRFSTCGTMFQATPARSSAAYAGRELESGRRLLNPRDRNDAVLIQTRLAELGHYTLAIDGAFGKGSYAALSEFKRANGLGDHFKWDLQTQKALFSGTGQ
jgi:hypothetical protein